MAQIRFIWNSDLYKNMRKTQEIMLLQFQVLP